MISYPLRWRAARPNSVSTCRRLAAALSDGRELGIHRPAPPSERLRSSMRAPASLDPRQKEPNPLVRETTRARRAVREDGNESSGPVLARSAAVSFSSLPPLAAPPVHPAWSLGRVDRGPRVAANPAEIEGTMNCQKKRNSCVLSIIDKSRSQGVTPPHIIMS